MSILPTLSDLFRFKSATENLKLAGAFIKRSVGLYISIFRYLSLLFFISTLSNVKFYNQAHRQIEVEILFWKFSRALNIYTYTKSGS